MDILNWLISPIVVFICWILSKYLIFNSFILFLLKRTINSEDKFVTILLENNWVIVSPNKVAVYGTLIIVVGSSLYKKLYLERKSSYCASI